MKNTGFRDAATAAAVALYVFSLLTYVLSKGHYVLTLDQLALVIWAAAVAHGNQRLAIAAATAFWMCAALLILGVL